MPQELPPPPDVNLPEVVVTGRRRRATTDTFPPQPPEPLPLADESIEPDPRQTGPCDDPLLRDEIDTDAAAAGALKEFKRRASNSGEPLELREYGAWIYRSADGSIRFGNVVRGLPYQASVDPWTDEALEGFTFDQVVGFIHNHPGGGASPSAADWHVYNDAFQRIVTAGG